VHCTHQAQVPLPPLCSQKEACQITLLQC
jgi:hypothetical protein